MRDHEEDVMTVLNEFFISTEDGFVNPRADKDIKQYKEFAEAGKRGAAKRWGTPPNGGANNPPNATPVATINHKPITTNQKPKKDSATSVACPDSVSQQVWNDWMTVRKEKKAKTLTETGWNGFVKQVEKAGWSLEQAISHCCLKQWVGFEASWVAPKLNPADIIRTTIPMSDKPDPALEKIKADAKKAAPIPENIRQAMAAIRSQP
jgi:hypothetical protein